MRRSSKIYYFLFLISVTCLVTAGNSGFMMSYEEKDPDYSGIKDVINSYFALKYEAYKSNQP
jgi:hypothetical protein